MRGLIMVAALMATACTTVSSSGNGGGWGTEGQACQSWSDGGGAYYCARGFACASNGSPAAATRLCMPRCETDADCNYPGEVARACIPLSGGMGPRYCVQLCTVGDRSCGAGLSCVPGYTEGRGDHVCWR